MDAPPIQYCRTRDHLNIAYCVFGEGPLVIPVETPGQSHVALEWEVPAIRRFHEGLAEHFLVARYNGRCSALSDCSDEALSMDTQAEDIRAVIEAGGREQAALVTMGPGLMYGLATALAHPEWVSCVVALLPMLRVHQAEPVYSAVREQIADPSAVIAGMPFWGGQGDPAGALTRFFTASWTPFLAHKEKHWDRLAGWDGEEDLGAIPQPILFVHWDAADWDRGVEFARRVPNSELVVRPGNTHPWYDPEPESLQTLIRNFVMKHPPRMDAARDERPVAAAVVELTPREREVVALVAAGQTNAEVAAALVISPATVTRHMSNILGKTGLRNRVELTGYAHEQGLTGD